MANSTQTATSDGTLTLLDLSIDYLDRAEIKVYENEVLSTTWAWVGTTDKQIKFTPAVANGVVIQVKRTTDASKLRHEFDGGAAFTAQSLDESLKQILHMSQEGLEIPGFAADMKMNGFRITDVSDPVAAQDAATKAWVETTTATSAAEAAASAASAAASYDSFDDRYLGPKEVAPTLDNDGAALLTGALYWDTTIPGMRSYAGDAWVTLPAATAGAVANTPAGSIAATTVQAAINELDAEKLSNGAGAVGTANLADLGVTTAKIAADAVTYAKIQDVTATDRLLGRATAGAGDVEEIVCTPFSRTLLDDADAATARETLGVSKPVIQRRRSTRSSVTSTTAIIPYDDTIPQITEGGLLFSEPFTPLSANSRIRITTNVQLRASAENVVRTVTVFRAGVADALGVSADFSDVATAGGIGFGTTTCTVDIPSPGTTAQTFEVRYGPHTASTLYVNSDTVAVRKYGGVFTTFVEIEEYLP